MGLDVDASVVDEYMRFMQEEMVLASKRAVELNHSWLKQKSFTTYEVNELTKALKHGLEKALDKQDFRGVSVKLHKKRSRRRVVLCTIAFSGLTATNCIEFIRCPNTGGVWRIKYFSEQILATCKLHW
jgi:hypothetical protein